MQIIDDQVAQKLAERSSFEIRLGRAKTEVQNLEALIKSCEEQVGCLENARGVCIRVEAQLNQVASQQAAAQAPAPAVAMPPMDAPTMPSRAGRPTPKKRGRPPKKDKQPEPAVEAPQGMTPAQAADF